MLAKPRKEASSQQPSAVPSDFFLTLPPKSTKASQSSLTEKKQSSWESASSNDTAGLYCLLCSEPLELEVVVSMPCKHCFHRVCIQRLDSPKCPLCLEPLPFSLFLPKHHPLTEQGFTVCKPDSYKPQFIGGPSQGSGGYPLHKPPPVVLYGIGGIEMPSYLHRIPPLGSEDDSLRMQVASQSHSFSDYEDKSCSSSSEDSEDSPSSDEDGLPNKGCTWAYTTCGKIRINHKSPSEPEFLPENFGTRNNVTSSLTAASSTSTLASCPAFINFSSAASTTSRIEADLCRPTDPRNAAGSKCQDASRSAQGSWNPAHSRGKTDPWPRVLHISNHLR